MFVGDRTTASTTLAGTVAVVTTKFCKDIVSGRPLACIDPEVKRSKLRFGWVSCVNLHVDDIDKSAQFSSYIWTRVVHL